MRKLTRTTYTIDHKDGTSTELFLEDDNLIIRHLWADGDIDTELLVPVTIGNLSDFAQALNELHSEAIGE